MSAHTPGPWSVDKFGMTVEAKSECKDLTHSIDGLDPICFVSGYFGDSGTQAANARLIAAAPDLLAALDACTGWLEWLDDPRSGLGDDHKKVIKQARIAIAKARGES